MENIGKSDKSQKNNRKDIFLQLFHRNSDINNPTNNAATRLKRFRIILIFHPKNFASTGRVVKPVIIKVVMKTAITG